MLRFHRWIGWVYEHWGTMSQLIVGLLAFVLSLFPSKVAEIEKSPKWRLFLPVLVGVVAITGYLVSESSTSNLQQQISTLYFQSQIEATKSDIHTLTDHIDNGFKSVVEAIKELCKPLKPAPTPKPAQAPPALPAPPHITVSQARALPSDPRYAYGLQVTVQSDQSVPVSFAIKCSGPIGAVNAFLVGQGAYLSKLIGVQPADTAIVRFGYPPLTPQSPLIVILSSQQDIRVLRVTPFEE